MEKKAKRYSEKLLVTVFVMVILVLSSYSEASLGDCDNSSDITFNCSGVGLTTIPSSSHVPSYYRTLDLSSNYINNISRLDFPLNNSINTLLLANNQIRKIEEKAFEQMTNLLTLDLSGNIFDGHTIKEKQFDGLTKLTKLLMERNPLGFIGKSTFMFSELFSLEHLDLSHCAINQIENGSIDLPYLKYLDLSWNELQYFYKESFTMLVSLNTLDLSHNRLIVFDQNQVPHLPKLNTWILDNNQIQNVSVGDDIQYLVYHLEHLYIRNNRIKRFTKESFPWNLESLKGIYLDNNPIECDCRMKWVVRDSVFKKRNFTILCKTPSKHKGKNLVTLTAEELRCGIALYKILLVLAAALAVILSFTGLVCLIVKRKKGKRGKKQTQVKKVNGTDYTAVYTKEADEIEIHVSDTKGLLLDNNAEKTGV